MDTTAKCGVCGCLDVAIANCPECGLPGCDMCVIYDIIYEKRQCDVCWDKACSAEESK